MSQAATIGLVEKYYAAFNAGDGEGMLACLTENITHDVNQGARQVGKDAFRAFLAHMDRSYAEQLTDIVAMTNADGSHAAAEFIVHGEYLSTDEGLPEAKGQKYVLPAGAFFDIEGGLIGRVTVYYNLEDWIAQVSA